MKTLVTLVANSLEISLLLYETLNTTDEKSKIFWSSDDFASRNCAICILNYKEAELKVPEYIRDFVTAYFL